MQWNFVDSIFIGFLNRMPNINNTRRANTNNSVKTNNSTKRRRRGAMTPNNAKRIKGTFSKPPIHPGKSRYSPPPASRPRVVYANNINIGNMTEKELNNLLKTMS